MRAKFKDLRLGFAAKVAVRTNNSLPANDLSSTNRTRFAQIIRRAYLYHFQSDRQRQQGAAFSASFG
jgi:hypothetical protein